MLPPEEVGRVSFVFNYQTPNSAARPSGKLRDGQRNRTLHGLSAVAILLGTFLVEVIVVILDYRIMAACPGPQLPKATVIPSVSSCLEAFPASKRTGLQIVLMSAEVFIEAMKLQEAPKSP
jgi:hypothetical protein